MSFVHIFYLPCISDSQTLLHIRGGASNLTSKEIAYFTKLLFYPFSPFFYSFFFFKKVEIFPCGQPVKGPSRKISTDKKPTFTGEFVQNKNVL